MAIESAILGGGCFWCIEAVFQRIDGVKEVVSGYTGGPKPNPTYKEVCTGNTGHVEVVKVDFDNSIVSFEKILDVFWQAHDPTTMNRQGADVGTQYRSAIFYTTDEQKTLAIQSRDAAQKDFASPIVTEIVPLKEFFNAEGYHQNYFNDNPNAPYCSYIIRPKIQKMGL